ncbi:MULTISPECIES: ribosomal protection-like ABC-F family protein [Clostridium]|uniref:ribosomal protection-like ABC-F family protein n=1 Tax=Clostridium TaxID=1485 RepID=UPI0012E4FC47|nr:MULTISPECIES: ABC-F family ATP-binding cassette domain-containing protein [Clostridium]MBS4781899.1 ABC-F family ATP-binding cassette domain-containing protein [Clostridium sp.]CAG9712997.1 Putative ABC transporter, ATPase component [Clostridium neonatale]CAI3611127.1 putative ABC transporter, ATPase component [Clostridium neonatale]CAI3682962.1 putative ABC transporter, ATPase component [Clostridium neonatale]SUQ52648.1 putative ABC transporter ATP-binding protein YheS [Clostridium neonata
MTVLMESKNLSKEYGENVIFNKIDFKIKLGETIGIVGSNGTGKTTLANIICGKIEPTSGEIIWYKNNVKIGYMKQATEYEDLESTLSGGEKTKKLLNDVIHRDYNFLVLDEPTNHLDYLGVAYLVKEIKKFNGTIIIISHDRYFLDQCVTRIIEIENQKITEYNGNYTYYRKKKQEDYENAVHLYVEQEKIKNRINMQIEELEGWSDKAHRESRKKAIETGNKFGGKEYNRVKAKKMDNQIKSRIKRLEKMKVEGLEKPKEEEKVLFQIKESKKIGAVVVDAKDISKSFDKKILFEKSSFYIKHGEKIGIYGPNGCGKTTFIKALLGKMDVDGDLYISPTRKIGYISQDVIGLNEECSIIELFNFENRQELGQLRTKLNLIGFNAEMLDRKVKYLSLGERMKLKIILMIQEQCEVLILDEPTNHIDLHVREQLEETLRSYNGTIILVTHDRYMLEKICDKLLVFNNKKIIRYEYGIHEYLNNIEKNKKKDKDKKSKNKLEEKILLENKITYILSCLSSCTIGSEEYKRLDEEYNSLITLRKSIKD